MRETQQKDLTLVIGGTGKTGRRVAERLAARGVPTRIGSRSSELPFDWEKEATWGPALQNVVSVYVTYFPDLVVPAALDDIRAFSKLAVESGVKRLVLLSGRGEDEAQRCERLVQESGAEWTIVRASWFAQNFSEAFLLEPLLGGVLALPAGSVGEPFVDAEDIADVAVAALTEDGHSGQLYEVTGPRLLTFAEAVAEIAKATGRDISYVQISNEEFSSQMAEHGVPEDVIGLITYLFDTVLDGRNSSMTDGVQRALGRPPRDFADYARDTAATGIWNVEGDAQ
jgi:uncharacterized protein YbjT (DUF2867 family)